MSMSEREKRFVFIGVIAVAVVFVYALAIHPLRVRYADADDLRDSAREEFVRLREDVRVKIELDRTLGQLEESLKVKVPSGPPAKQIEEFVKAVEQAAGKSQSKITSWTRRSRSKRQEGDSPGDAVQFSFRLETKQEGLVKFLEGLTDLQRPLVIRSLDVKGDGKQPDKLTVQMEIHTYIFDGKAS